MRGSRAKGRRPARFHDLLFADVIWEADVINVAALIGKEAPELPGPLVVLALEVESGAVVCSEELADATPASFAQILVNAMKRPDTGRPRRPRHIVVRDEQHAAALGAIVPHGSTVSAQPQLPHLDEMKQHVAREITKLSSFRRTYMEIAERRPEIAAAFFHAAAAFYASAPWDLLDDETPVALELEGAEGPLYVVVLGGAGVTHGLALYANAAALNAAFEDGDEPETAIGETVAVTYVAETDVGEEASEERRRHRWRLAGPAAYPLLMCTDEHGELSEPELADLERVTFALSAIERLVREDSATIARREVLSREFQFDGPSGTTRSVRVAFPAELDPPTTGNLDLFAGASVQPIADAEDSTYRRGAARLADVVRRIFGSRQIRLVLQRLAWSFFHDRMPSYLLAEEQEDAVTRFYDWVCFLAPVGPEGRSFACLANNASSDLDEQERLERAALLKVVYVVARVVSVRRGQGFSLADVFTEELYHVQQPDSVQLPRNRDWYFGVLLPLGAGEYLPGGSAFAMRPVREQERQLMELRDTDAKARPLAVEDIVFGASSDWIDELSPRELRDAYASFRADLSADLPPLPQLKKRIQAADAPPDVLGLAAKVEWAGSAEVNVFGAFVQRLWNTTPRKELGGISPEEFDSREHG